MAEKTRSEKLKRLVAVQRHLEQMAEYDLAETNRQRAEVSQSIDTVVTALGSMDPSHRAFSQSYADRFERLSTKDKQLTGMEQLHEMRLQQERAKGDRLEESMKDALEEERREADDNAVYDIIDQKSATPPTRMLQKP